MTTATQPDTFDHNGLTCEVKLTSMGHYCGYVTLPAGHPLHGVSYSDSIAVPQSVIDRDIDIDKIGAINLLCASVKPGDTSLDLVLAVDVHGGLTYSRANKDGGWVLGFDCAHAGDARTPDDTNGIWRDAAFVAAECRSMADQVQALAAYAREVSA